MTVPYYQDENVTIFHGNCREIMPELTFDVIVTDPPYGINLDTTRSAAQFAANPKDKTGRRRASGTAHRPVAGDDVPFDPTTFLQWPAAFTGANYFAQRLPETGRWHVWDKTNRGEQPTGLNNEFEMIWTSWPSGRSVIVPILWAGFHRINNHPESFSHPTTHPTTLMEWIIKSGPPGVILDPFLGSGTTLRAAKDLGRHAIGIELEEKYCEIAATRMGQEVLDLWV
jgi:DNA modification methylase